MISFNSISQKMSQTGIIPSVQRIEIMEYLLTCGGHPAAEQVYRALKQRGLRISKATVYNTLRLFAEKGLVRVLAMENNENRFDRNTQDHGHFICERCGAISDFAIGSGDAVNTVSGALLRCRIRQRDVYYRGICPDCLQKESKEGEHHE